MEKIKVKILSKCTYCDGQAYLPSGMGVDYEGGEYQHYLPCPTCNGSGKTGKWITLPEFQKLLKEASCQHEHVTQVGGFHFSDDVWDDLKDICDACGELVD